MRCIIPINEPSVDGKETSVTCKVVDFGDVPEHEAYAALVKLLMSWNITRKKAKKLALEYFPNGYSESQAPVSGA